MYFVCGYILDEFSTCVVNMQKKNLTVNLEKPSQNPKILLPVFGNPTSISTLWVIISFSHVVTYWIMQATASITDVEIRTFSSNLTNKWTSRSRLVKHKPHDKRIKLLICDPLLRPLIEEQKIAEKKHHYNTILFTTPWHERCYLIYVGSNQ